MSKLKGHENCMVSTTMYDALSFGSGELDFNGFWENGCYECARNHEKDHPEDGECWPHSEETLNRIKRKETNGKL